MQLANALLALPFLLAAATAAGCGARQNDSMPPRYLSAAEHDRQAATHDHRAAEQDKEYRTGTHPEDSSRPLHCFDQPVEIPDPVSGGQRMPVIRPCWTREQMPLGAQRRAAIEHRREADRHRTIAASLRRAERESCTGLGEDERSHSPFFHREDILRVEPVLSGGALRGARVSFRRVPGLSAAWMRQALACHQSRAAALGYPATVMAYCPLMLAPTSVTVEETATALVVTLRADRDEQAAAIHARARALPLSD